MFEIVDLLFPQRRKATSAVAAVDLGAKKTSVNSQAAAAASQEEEAKGRAGKLTGGTNSASHSGCNKYCYKYVNSRPRQLNIFQANILDGQHLIHSILLFCVN